MSDLDTYNLVLELRNALAAAMRVLVVNDWVEVFLMTARQAEVKDGIGKRADEWLEKNVPKKEVP